MFLMTAPRGWRARVVVGRGGVGRGGAGALTVKYTGTPT